MELEQKPKKSLGDCDPLFQLSIKFIVKITTLINQTI